MTSTGILSEHKLSSSGSLAYIPEACLDQFFSFTVTFDFNFSPVILKNIKLRLIGLHQAENCSLALACLALLSKRGKFSIDEKNLRKALEKISIPGRFEIKKVGKNTVIIDVAHNPQKMDAFIRNLAILYHKQKFNFLVAFKKGKDNKAMLKKIIPLADKIFLTHFSTKNMDNDWNSIDNELISKFLKTQRFTNFEIVDNKKIEIQKIIKASKKPVVITGSLYLIGSIYSFLKKSSV